VDALNLSYLLEDLAAEGPEGLAAAVTGIAYRSDRVSPGDAFFCIRGYSSDGHDFAADAEQRGAGVIVVTRPIEGLGVPQVLVANTRRALAVASSRFFGEPSQHLRMAGITGTNGKTTTTYLLDSVLRAAGLVTGVIGTVGTSVAGESLPAARTTPESRDLQELLSTMVGAGVGAVSLEVSSHAIELHRVDAVRFAVAAFTNLSQDHLDFHANIDEYFGVKSRLFDGTLPAGARVINIDDPYGRELAARTGAEWTVGRDPEALVRAEDVELTPVESRFRLVTPKGPCEVTLPLAGEFNVSNALVAAGCALALGIAPDAIAAGLARAPQVPGRLERIDEGQPFAVLVDYAHTPDGLEKAISAVRDVTAGRVITVFGCGGDRDASKRPLMGEAAGRLSDIVVITSDNPRSEDPARILGQIEAGLAESPAEVFRESDRRRAIGLAISFAQPDDAVLIAGKGHEDYQLFAARSIHFDDREVAREELMARC
jgi:UDP-N-acetylmuramoyl-L-alanyl-D-glutamate--2,6-diaminopimelate ligase